MRSGIILLIIIMLGSGYALAHIVSGGPRRGRVRKA